MATNSRTKAKEDLQTAIITLAAKALPVMDKMIEIEKAKLEALSPLKLELQKQSLEIKSMELKLALRELEPNPQDRLVEEARARLELLQIELEIERLQQSRRDLYRENDESHPYQNRKSQKPSRQFEYKFGYDEESK
tara:strand:- start:336 stop:746 length:411 start_codon:yes stop_codon:yes gene_type:complete